MSKEGVPIEGVYHDMSNKHYKNKKIYAAINHETILQQFHNLKFNFLNKKRKQFVVVFYLFYYRRSIVDYSFQHEFFGLGDIVVTIVYS